MFGILLQYEAEFEIRRFSINMILFFISKCLISNKMTYQTMYTGSLINNFNILYSKSIRCDIAIDYVVAT